MSLSYDMTFAKELKACVEYVVVLLPFVGDILNNESVGMCYATFTLKNQLETIHLKLRLKIFGDIDLHNAMHFSIPVFKKTGIEIRNRQKLFSASSDLGT